MLCGFRWLTEYSSALVCLLVASDSYSSVSNFLLAALSVSVSLYTLTSYRMDFSF